ncbi:MAG TPA: fibronectin type III domain-containing protein [Segetibacter sp.]
MKKGFQILLVYLSVAITGFGQSEEGYDKLLRAANSPKGNYIYLYNQIEQQGIAGTTDYFVIERMKYDSTKVNAAPSALKAIGEARKVQSLAELKQYYSQKDIEEIKAFLSMSSDEEVLNYFVTHQDLKDFPVLYESVETRQALGEVFLDKNVVAGEVYFYRLTRVLKNKSKEPWGYSVAQSNAGNYTLPYYKPVVNSVQTFDSSVTITWKVPVPPNLVNEIPVPKSNLPMDKDASVLKMPFPPSSTRAKVFVNKNGKFVQVQKLFPGLNASKDTISYYYSQKCLPEENVTAFLVTEDEVYNQGISSDTAYTFAIEKKNLPLIYGIRITDVVNGIQLSWDKLPAKPYLAGVEINRYNSEDKLDSIATVPIGDTSYTDYAVKVGEHYRYKVKAVFIPQTGLVQEIPAEGIGTFTKFTRPLPPYNMKVENVGKNVLLKWDALDEPSFYGFYIYRGTSEKNLSVVAGPVFTKSFLDTAGSLSGRSQYFYAVVNQNLMQDTSIYSPVVSIVPDRKLNTAFPNNVQFYYANGRLRIMWNDVREDDNAIRAFVVQKKLPDDKQFTRITQKPVTDNFVEDTAITAGVPNQYRVAAVTYKGEQSEYGEIAEFTLPKTDVSVMNVFNVRNVTEGIHISWPAMEFPDRSSYNIFRREAATAKFTRIAAVPNNTFFYVDKTVKPNQVYVYKMSITESDKREGPAGKSVSIRKTK